MAETSIEWTDKTWNPLVGCSRVSPGCEHCYAETMAARHVLMSEAQGRRSVYLPVVDAQRRRWTRQVELLPDRLDDPLSWRPGTRVFVVSMGDPFHDEVPFDYLARMWGVMAAKPAVTFQVLTKRPGRMLAFFRHVFFGLENLEDTVFREAMEHRGVIWDARAPRMGWPRGSRPVDYAHLYPQSPDPKTLHRRLPWVWPLPNVWLGTSVEDQLRADARIPELLQCPAAVRFISAEPLLGPLRLYHVGQTRDGGAAGPATFRWIDALRGGEVTQVDDGGPAVSLGGGPRLDWVIVGGESGPGARPMDEGWARSLRDQCELAGAAFFFKQWGGVRKKAAGRVLDGRTHDAMPEVRRAA